MHDDEGMVRRERLGLDGDHQKQCENCRYFCPNGEQGDGDCRRHAPQPANVRYRHRDDDNARFVSWWPEVNSDDWCGDFEEIDGKDW